MRWRGVLAGLLLVLAAAAAPAAERIADPTREFVGGYDPSQNDFFANTPERTVLLRIRDDLDGDGVADLALSESSTWGQAGGQWLLFRGEAGGGYVYWGSLFFSPGSVAIGPHPGALTASPPRGGVSRPTASRRPRSGWRVIGRWTSSAPPIARRTTPPSAQGGGPPSSTASSSRTGAIRRDAGSPGSVASPRYTCRP